LPDCVTPLRGKRLSGAALNCGGIGGLSRSWRAPARLRGNPGSRLCAVRCGWRAHARRGGGPIQGGGSAAPAKPDADFTPVSTASGRSHFDAHRSQVVSRSMFTDEYTNPDGTHTFKQSSGSPLNVKDAAGAWQPVDTGLVPEPSGRLRGRLDQTGG
jgi:hypothetical protein